MDQLPLGQLSREELENHCLELEARCVELIEYTQVIEPMYQQLHESYNIMQKKHIIVRDINRDMLWNEIANTFFPNLPPLRRDIAEVPGKHVGVIQLGSQLGEGSYSTVRHGVDR